MYSSVIPGTKVFCDWPLLTLSCVSLETAANFHLSHSAAITRKRESSTVLKTELGFYFIIPDGVFSGIQSPLLERKSFNPYKQLLRKKNSSNKTKGCKLDLKNSTFVSPIYTFSLAANLIVYMPFQGTNKEKYFNYIIYKGEVPTLAGNKHLSVHSFFRKPRLFHLSTEKCRGLIRQKWTSNCFFPRWHNK